jgi:hypothetical protein
VLAVSAALLLMASPAGAVKWSDTAPATGFFGPEDIAYYEQELGAPVTLEPGLTVQLGPDLAAGLVARYVLGPGERIVSVRASSDVPDVFLHWVSPHDGPVWRVKISGRYPMPTACPPPPSKGQQTCNPPPGPDYIAPTIVFLDRYPSGFAFFR